MAGITYGEALRLADLLVLQHPFSAADPHHDELQYVIIHQCSELWFKLLLHELDEIGRRLAAGQWVAAGRLFRRATGIVEQVDGAFRLMETMTARDYAQFRPRLAGGSGFQSAQFRELEAVLGCAQPGAVQQPAFTAAEQERINFRLGQPTLWATFLTALCQQGYVPVGGDSPESAPGDASCQHLARRYAAGDPPELVDLMEAMVAFDAALARWRMHHAVMAERAIGSKVGTGGAGVDYLYARARVHAFPGLWSLRAWL